MIIKTLDMKNYIKKGSYDKRLKLLRLRWDQLMIEQDHMSHAEIISDAFQAKKQRIGNLYSIAKKESNREGSDKISALLNRVHDMASLPYNKIITFNV